MVSYGSLSFCQCESQPTSPCCRCNALCWHWEWLAATSRWSRGAIVELGMCYLNLTGCHLYLYPATMSITTGISLTGSIPNALAPVLKLQSRAGICYSESMLAPQNEGGNGACAGASHQERVRMRAKPHLASAQSETCCSLMLESVTASLQHQLSRTSCGRSTGTY